MPGNEPAGTHMTDLWSRPSAFSARMIKALTERASPLGPSANQRAEGVRQHHVYAFDRARRLRG